MRKLKRLGEGYIWFGWNDKVGTYTNVSLATKPNRSLGNKPVPIKRHRLGAWKKVRLLVEVIE
jgi:hypothetical protein